MRGRWGRGDEEGNEVVVEVLEEERMVVKNVVMMGEVRWRVVGGVGKGGLKVRGVWGAILLGLLELMPML